MKKLWMLFILVISATSSYAQALDTLPLDKDLFVKGLVKMFDDTKRSELKDLTKTFTKKVDDGSFNEAVLEKMMLTTNQFIKMRGKAYPQLADVTKHYLKLNELNLSNERINNFQDVFNQVMQNAKKGDTKSTLKFLEFVIPLFESNALYFSNAKTWTITSDIYSLKYTEEGPIVEVPKTHIVGKSPTDSLNIGDSGGFYDYNTTTWHGTKGRVDWSRAGLPVSEVFCSFGEYTIDMSTQTYEIENVVFTYKNYFERELKGKLEDKLTNTSSADLARFPRFIAYSDDVPPQVISDNVMYYGGFTLSGSKISGDSDSGNSRLEIFEPNSKRLVLNAQCESITINKPEKVTASNAEVALYFEKDSIYHPSITAIYNLQTNEIRLVKGEGALAQSKFIDSYHKMDFEADVLTWNLDNSYIDVNTVSTSGNKAAIYESQEYFSKEKLKQIRGNVTYDPLSILNKYADTYQYNDISGTEYAKLIGPNLTVQQIKPLIFKLIQEGFITYDDKSQMIQILPKVKHYVKANAKLIDFDNIYIQSKTKKQNARIDLTTKDVHLEGVQSVPVSMASSTIFIPDSLKITVKEDRDMVFNGLFFCGRLDLFGKENYFDYETFNMDLPQIDTVIFNIPDGDKTDAYGNPVTRPLNSTLEELKGNININIPINKSGRSELAQFPIFTSTEKSRIYYDNADILGGAYDRESFYYELVPFELDSLNYLNPRTLTFDGTLMSSDIFPAIDQKVSVQSDLSLGFQIASPPDGFEIYKGKGRFTSDISLNNKGLTGKGIIKYMTTSFESSNIVFYPDSLIATTDTLGVAESKGQYESPWVKSAQNLVKWYPYLDSMIAFSDDVHPFNMYDDRIRLDGELIITDEGISGGGIADWDDAQLISNRFEFRADQILSDTAELKVKTIDGDKVTFNTPNVNAYVDFTNNTGYFKSNTDENKTDFNYNQYYTTIDEFFWDIDNKILEFSVPTENKIGAPFISVHPDQDSLGFYATSADYSLESFIIEAHGVEEILVADSRIIPEGGEVVIEPEAKMRTLNNAVIEASAESKRHIIEEVTATITGKNAMKASGAYNYSTLGADPQYINLSAIEVIVADSSVLDKKKVDEVQHILHATGTVTQNENFVLYPNVTFYGGVELYSSLDNLIIDGFTKIDFKNEYIISDFFELKTQVDPENLLMTVEGAKDPQGNLIRTGIFVSKTGMTPMYTNILNNEIGPIDVGLIETNENLSHDYNTNTYTFGNAEKAADKSLIKKGNVLRFEPTTNKVLGQGSLDLALDFAVVDEKVAGEVKTDLSTEDYEFDIALAFPFDLDKSVLEKMSYYLFEDNFDMGDVNYEKTSVLQQWAELVSDKSMKKMQEEVATTGYFEKPKDLKETLVFSDVKMNYDPLERVYRSEGKLGLSFVGDKGIHKRVNGHIELGHRLGSDYMNLYLKTSLGDWFYVTFSGTNMEIITSLDDVNSAINGIDAGKRRVKGDDNSFYLYFVGSEMKARSFLQRMKALKNGVGGVDNPFANPQIVPPTESSDTIRFNGGAVPRDEAPTPEPEVVPEPKTAPPTIPDAVREFEENAAKKKGKGKKEVAPELPVEEEEEKVDEAKEQATPDIKDAQLPNDDEKSKKGKASKENIESAPEEVPEVPAEEEIIEESTPDEEETVLPKEDKKSKKNKAADIDAEVSDDEVPDESIEELEEVVKDKKSKKNNKAEQQEEVVK